MIRCRDVSIVNKALKYAVVNSHEKKYTMVAFLAHGKKIISIGINSYKKTHPATFQESENYLISTHAEVSCISKWIVKNRKISDDMTMYVVGITKSKQIPHSTKPCKSCQQLIKATGIKRVVYLENREELKILESFPSSYDVEVNLN